MHEGTALTPQEVAEILKVAKNTVYELIKRGELNSYKVGKKIRVDLNDVEDYKNKTKNRPLNKTNNTNSLQNIPQLPVEPLIFPINDLNNNSNFVICGQDILLDILSRYLEQHPNGVRSLRSYTGSYNGLIALYHGRVQIATAHLWDGDSNEYNIPFVRRLIPGIPTVLIHIAYRMQGFYVAKGNPKNIKGWEDLKRSDLTIINREKGSGTRILLDEHLRLMGIDRNVIKGYNRECSTHLAVASTVARGDADLALGNEKNCLQVCNVDFIPIQREKYDLVMKKEDMEKPSFQAIIEILRSENFKKDLSGIGGYNLSEIGTIVTEL